MSDTQEPRSGANLSDFKEVEPDVSIDSNADQYRAEGRPGYKQPAEDFSSSESWYPDSEPERKDVSEIATELMHGIYDLMLDEDTEGAYNKVFEQILTEQVKGYNDAKRHLNDNIAQELTRFQQTHICLPATGPVVDYVNKLIQAKIDDENAPESDRSEIALKMISALYE